MPGSLALTVPGMVRRDQDRRPGKCTGASIVSGVVHRVQDGVPGMVQRDQNGVPGIMHRDSENAVEALVIFL